MGEIDISAKRYISQNKVFADIFNFKLFQGNQVIRPNDLYETSPEELGFPYGNKQTLIAVSKMRDLLKQCVIKSTNSAHYILLGVENQANIHYALPVKLMVYDALNYATQVSTLAKSHKLKRDFINGDEFLSEFKKNDKIRPVITLVLYLGSKEWDGPRNLQEMLDIPDLDILHFINNYKVNLIIPHEIQDFDQFHSNLKYVLEFIKVSKSREEAARLLEREKDIFSKLDIETAFLISKCTNIPIKRSSQKGVVNMCKAWEEQKMEGIKEGIAEGQFLKCTQLARIKHLKNVTPEDCADMLEEDVNLIKKIYTLITDHPDWDDSKICKEIISCKISII